MTDNFDLIVIGAGSAGLTAARTAAALGARVALVERDRIGGDCTWYGCIPSKALIRVARAAHEVRTADRFGIDGCPPDVDMSRVRQHLNEVIETIRALETPEQLADEGIEFVTGEASFLDDRTINLGASGDSGDSGDSGGSGDSGASGDSGDSGGSGRQLRGRRFIVATGAAPRIPHIQGLRDIPFLTYRSIFALEHLPERLLVLGAGPTGCELAQAFGRLGSRVTLIDESVLPTMDKSVGHVILSVLEAEGVQFVTGLVTRARMDNGEVVISVGSEIGTENPVDVRGDIVLVATGRQPVLKSLTLDRADVERSLGGILVDEYLRTSAPRIYAAGDCIADNPHSTHLAGWQAARAVQNALLPFPRRKGTPAAIPRVVYTDPEVAIVGLGVTAAREQHGNNVQAFRRPIRRVDRALTDGEEAGFIELVHDGKGRILGGSIVASRAGEVITELALAVEKRLRLSDLANIVHPYPTYSIAIQRMAGDAELTRVMSGRLGKVISWLTNRVR